MNTHDYYTPIVKCIYVHLGLVDPGIVDGLKHNQYDQAIVKDSNSNIVGIIATQRLQYLIDNKMILSETDEGLSRPTVNFPLSLNKVLSTLSKSRSALVVQENSANEITTNLGLISISDLNRHPFRSMLYCLLVELEVELAIFIEESFTEPWEWIKLLNEDAQASILGYWELSKRRNVDIGPVAATTLSQLLNVVQKGKLTSILGFKSNNEFGNMSGSIPKLRNSVMHPVRPLILDLDSLNEVKGTVESIDYLIEKVKMANLKTNVHV